MTSYNHYSQLTVKVGNSISKTNKYSTLFSPVYTSSLAGNIIAYMPSQGTNRENYFRHKKNKGVNADSGGK